MKPLILLCCGLFGGLSVAMAQEPPPPVASPTPALEKPALPGGPLLIRMRGFTSWKITYAYPEDKAKKPASGKPSLPNDPGDSMLEAAPRIVTVTRTGPLWYAVTVDVKGNTMEQGGDGTDNFLTLSSDPAPVLAPTNSDGRLAHNLVDYSRVDFPDMSWISAQTYVGIQQNGDATWLAFKHPSAEGEVTAWIDLATRFPVAWQRGKEVRTFQQLPAPTSPLVFPQTLDKLYQALKKDRDSLKRPPPRGG